jgi:hypothetical protein
MYAYGNIDQHRPIIYETRLLFNSSASVILQGRTISAVVDHDFMHFSALRHWVPVLWQVWRNHWVSRLRVQLRGRPAFCSTATSSVAA